MKAPKRPWRHLAGVLAVAGAISLEEEQEGVV